MAFSTAYPTTLANLAAGNQPLSTLDSNISPLYTGMNLLNTYGNYYVDTGAANAYVITLTAQQTLSLAAGLPVQFKASANNTGASTLNANGTGVKSILRQTGGALLSGDIVTTGMTSVMYDGTNYILLSPYAILAGGTDTGLVGGARQLKMNNTVGVVSIVTFTADELVLETALGGTSQKFGSFSKTLNTSVAGAGGMDTGGPPSIGYISVYAIGQTGGSVNVLGVNSTTVAATYANIYGGANMPANYTVSALIAIIPTDSVGRIMAGVVLDRKFMYQTFVSIFSGTTGPAALSIQSVSAGVPAGARAADIVLLMNTINGGWAPGIAGDATGSGGQQFLLTSSNASDTPGVGGMATAAGITPFKDVPLTTAQTVYWNDPRARSDTMYVSGYTI